MATTNECNIHNSSMTTCASHAHHMYASLCVGFDIGSVHAIFDRSRLLRCVHLVSPARNIPRTRVSFYVPPTSSRVSPVWKTNPY